MSDSEVAENATPTRPGKRERLVRAATELVHRQGVERTTLADIAKAADVPLGNIYYYFKTRDEIVDAVVDTHVQGVEEMIGSLGRHRTPKKRLKALVGVLADRSDVIASFGCPHGTLCSELEKTRDDHEAGRLIRIPLAWLEEQFSLLGRRDARELAIKFLVSYQGTAVLTHALRDPSLMRDEATRLERWIDSL
jgi:AcrR family transcriptional regulator